MMKKKKYYLLPLDGYRQPIGTIEEIMLTKKEYEEMNNNGQYVFTSYASALIRAQD